jgi:hypothetical protein
VYRSTDRAGGDHECITWSSTSFLDSRTLMDAMGLRVRRLKATIRQRTTVNDLRVTRAMSSELMEKSNIAPHLVSSPTLRCLSTKYTDFPGLFNVKDLAMASPTTPAEAICF